MKSQMLKMKAKSNLYTKPLHVRGLYRSNPLAGVIVRGRVKFTTLNICY